MKKLVASVGLAALGTSLVEAASSESGVGTTPLYPVSLAATVRGFYDDNVTTSNPKFDSFGFELSPSVSIANWKPDELNTLSLGYVYSAKYYFSKPPGNDTHWDQGHTFNLDWLHLFSERYKIDVKDAFVIGQEPDILRTGVSQETFQRIPGDNIRNFGNIEFNAQITPVFGTAVGYANTYYSYSDTGETSDGQGHVAPSLAGTLNRLENTFHVDGRFSWHPETTFVIGYQYRDISYTGDEIIAGTLTDPTIPNGTPLNPSTDIIQNDPDFPTAKSDDRNNRLHYAYVGVDQIFRPDLSMSVRGGASFSDFYNDPNHSTSVAPYANLSVRYNYTPASMLEFGFTYDRNSTDLVGFNIIGNQVSFTTDQEAATVYASVSQAITPRLTGSLLGQFQNSVYNGGAFDKETDRLFLLGLNFEYQFTPHLSGHFGYTYDKLDAFNESGFVTHPNFDRNRVYIGLTANY